MSPPPTEVRPQVGFVRQVLSLARKELSLERHAGLRTSALLPFAAVVLLLFALACGPEPRLHARLGAAFVWLALLLGSTLGLRAAQAAEDDEGASAGLLLLGVTPAAQFCAKAAINALLVVVLGAMLWPIAFALLGLTLVGSGWALAGVLALGALALSLPGTLLAALAGRARGSEVLLPLLLYPLIVPGLMAAVRATSLLLLGDPLGEFGGWVTLLGCFDLVYGLLGAALMEQVLEA